MIISGSRKLAIYGWETASSINYGNIGRRIWIFRYNRELISYAVELKVKR